MTTAPVLRLSGVHQVYGSGRRAFHALRDVSLEVAPGETVGLVGESGSGKSTTARVAAGLQRPTSGEVELLGTRIERLRQRALRPLRADLGYVFQNPYGSLNPRRTVGDAVAMPFVVQRGVPAAAVRSEVLDLLERVGLEPSTQFADAMPHELSGGQRQRVAIARAVALRPRLIIADEPVSALDVTVSTQVLNLLLSIQQEIGSSIVFISHDLGLVGHLCDRVLVMNRGEVVESGPTTQVLTEPQHAYTRGLIASAPHLMSRADLAARSA